MTQTADRLAQKLWQVNTISSAAGWPPVCVCRALGEVKTLNTNSPKSEVSLLHSSVVTKHQWAHSNQFRVTLTCDGKHISNTDERWTPRYWSHKTTHLCLYSACVVFFRVQFDLSCHHQDLERLQWFTSVSGRCRHGGGRSSRRRGFVLSLSGGEKRENSSAGSDPNGDGTHKSFYAHKFFCFFLFK